jgi:hypothetical protein
MQAHRLAALALAGLAVAAQAAMNPDQYSLSCHKVRAVLSAQRLPEARVA